MNVRKRRKINIHATLEKYKIRLLKVPLKTWKSLENTYLGSFNVYNTIACDEIVGDRLKHCHEYVLMTVANDMGINVLGITSERKIKNKYICFDLLGSDTRDNSQVVYVGKYNYFTQHEPHPIFSIRSEDKIYFSLSEQE